MGELNSKSLVIDTNVVRSAGDQRQISNQEVSEILTSKNCYDFLDTVRDSEHKIFMTQDIYEQWYKLRKDTGKPYISDFSHRWYREMFERERVIEEPISPDSLLKERVINSVKPEAVKQKKDMLEDYFLLEAALASNKTGISLDDKVRKLFSQASQNIDEIKEIVWVNPDKSEEKAIEWLTNGAPTETQRFLVNYLPKNTK
jgi:hypothetical protein